jgi:hypothetical protein
MGTCLALIVLAWNVVRLWSTTAAVAMSVIAAVLLLVDVLIANWWMTTDEHRPASAGLQDAPFHRQ